MRAHSAQNRVRLNASDIYAFMTQYPGANLIGLKGVCFGFDKTGALVEIDYDNGNSECWDGPGLVALSQDAETYLAAAGDTSVRRELREDYRKQGFPWWWPDWWRR